MEEPLVVAFPSLPRIVRFKKQDVGGTIMRVADLPSGPFFLDRKQFKLLRCFAEGSPQKDIPKLVAVVGPVKSGKSAIVMDVLPTIIGSEHAKAGGPTPVLFPFTFEETDVPSTAAMRLLSSASRFAAAIGFTLAVPVTPELALLGLGDVMGEFARGISSKGGELCILLDELQVGTGGCRLHAHTSLAPFRCFPQPWAPPFFFAPPTPPPPHHHHPHTPTPHLSRRPLCSLPSHPPRLLCSPAKSRVL
jgi:hypothetical protein